MKGFGTNNRKKNKQNLAKNSLQLLGEAVTAHKKGDLENAESLYLKVINSGFPHEIALSNLGVIYKNTGRQKEAISIYKQAISTNPLYADAYSNLGNLYVELGSLDQALASTLKSLELKPGNPNAHTNLGRIHKRLGNLDEALASTLQSLELKPNNPGAINCLKGFIDQLKLTGSNAKQLTRAYDLLLNQTDISHSNLTRIFLQGFLPAIETALASDPIISNNNQALKALANDWRFRKSLTLMIPPSIKVEKFFTKLRTEILTEVIQKGSIPQQLKPLTEALAIQCHLNEFVYFTSKEEEEAISKIIKKAAINQDSINQNLAIIACYKPIHTIDIIPEFLNKYASHDESSKELIASQFKEHHYEKEIKASFQETHNITDTTSQVVQKMYEENPYPRFKHADFVRNESAEPIFKYIESEATKTNLTFSKELKSTTNKPKVLIAGCGTGKQVIMASRYKNAEFTAIDLSTSSLAYAIRKTEEYGMKNITFKKMDLLNIADLGDIFDIIECSGVLHHMEEPANGLSALVQQLKSGGYIKIGLYSEIARKVVVEARETIKKLGIVCTPKGIRDFRKKVLDGEISELQELLNLGIDFYSLSECRDLCFHVQEHRFTTDSLKKLLDSHGLTFCGFMVPEQIKKLYQEQYPGDIDMTSLPNWGEFEEKFPSTFTGMYQFWAHKPS